MKHWEKANQEAMRGLDVLIRRGVLPRFEIPAEVLDSINYPIFVKLHNQLEEALIEMGIDPVGHLTLRIFVDMVLSTVAESRGMDMNEATLRAFRALGMEVLPSEVNDYVLAAVTIVEALKTAVLDAMNEGP